MRDFKNFEFGFEKETYKLGSKVAGSVYLLVLSATYISAWKICLQQCMRPQAQPEFC